MNIPACCNATPRAAARVSDILKVASLRGVLGVRSDSVSRVLAALCDPAISITEIAALVGRDPALSLRVLRVANSAYYAQSRSIGTIDRALSVLGVNSVRGIAAAVCLDRMLTLDAGTATQDLKAMLNHSRATATAAESLARIARPMQVADAFIAGLLHNVGTIVQPHLGIPGARALMQQADHGLHDIRQLEAHLDVIGHEECGAVIFAAWNLPEPLIAAARHHHRPQESPQANRDLVALIHLGSHLALAAGYTFSLEPNTTPTDPSAIAQLGLDDDAIAAVAADLPERMTALDEALFCG
jgi:HD-like signal output (HDOD) protein